MSWEGCLAAIDAHLVAAGLTLDPKITYVRASEPVAVPQHMMAYWYEGDEESATGGNTFGLVNNDERVTITVYWRVGDRKDDFAANLEVATRAAKQAILTELWGDVYLNGNAIGIDVGNTQTGWVQYEPDRWARTLTVPLTVQLAGDIVIAA